MIVIMKILQWQNGDDIKTNEDHDNIIIMHRNDNGGADGSYVNECECANGYAKSDEMYLADIHGLLRLVNVQIGLGKGESRAH